MTEYLNDFENETNPKCYPQYHVYMNMTIIVKQVYWYISQVSVYRTIGPLFQLTGFSEVVYYCHITGQISFFQSQL